MSDSGRSAIPLVPTGKALAILSRGEEEVADEPTKELNELKGDIKEVFRDLKAVQLDMRELKSGQCGPRAAIDRIEENLKDAIKRLESTVAQHSTVLYGNGRVGLIEDLGAKQVTIAALSAELADIKKKEEEQNRFQRNTMLALVFFLLEQLAAAAWILTHIPSTGE